MSREISTFLGRLETRDTTDAGALAADAWRGLLTGRWLLVDRFERGGRRYFVAKRNETTDEILRRLTARERSILDRVVLGHSNKIIAYDLGISQTTVSNCVKRACEKLGARSKTELIPLRRIGCKLFRAPADATSNAWWRADNFLDASADPKLVPLDVARQEIALFSCSAACPAKVALTKAEQSVFHGLLAGLTNAGIAAAKGRSERTVANQVAAIYRKLGVGSRTELLAAHAAWERVYSEALSERRAEVRAAS